MKIKVKPKVVVKVLVVYWSCLLILWLFLKKIPEIKERNFTTISFQIELADNTQTKEVEVK